MLEDTSAWWGNSPFALRWEDEKGRMGPSHPQQGTTAEAPSQPVGRGWSPLHTPTEGTPFSWPFAPRGTGHTTPPRLGGRVEAHSPAPAVRQAPPQAQVVAREAPAAAAPPAGQPPPHRAARGRPLPLLAEPALEIRAGSARLLGRLLRPGARAAVRDGEGESEGTVVGAREGRGAATRPALAGRRHLGAAVHHGRGRPPLGPAARALRRERGPGTGASGPGGPRGREGPAAAPAGARPWPRRSPLPTAGRRARVSGAFYRDSGRFRV